MKAHVRFVALSLGVTCGPGEVSTTTASASAGTSATTMGSTGDADTATGGMEPASTGTDEDEIRLRAMYVHLEFRRIIYVRKQNLTRRHCAHFGFETPGFASNSVVDIQVPSGWGINAAYVVGDSEVCWNDDSGSVLEHALEGTGVVTWSEPDDPVIPCTIDVDATLLLPASDLWPPEEHFLATDLVVEDSPDCP